MNYVAGGPAGSGISAGMVVPVFFPAAGSRTPWLNRDAVLNQELLDAAFPFIELNWVADIYLGDDVFRVSNKNLYVQDAAGLPRFYEARVQRGPSIKISLGEWLSAQYEISDMKLTLNNRDGFFNRLLPQGDGYRSWTSSLVQIRVGFGEKATNYFTIFEGFVTAKKGVEVSDTDVIIKCYDRTDADEITIPGTYFYDNTAPYIDPTANGKSVPLVYGDWSTEVGDYGQVPATCLNALEDEPAQYVFKVSQNALQEIGAIYLHRGDRTATSTDGPIRIKESAIVRSPANGQFSIVATVPALDEPAVVYDRAQAGVGSTTNLITSDAVNFIDKGVHEGDRVIKTSTSQEATVIGVANNQLSLSGGITWAEKDEYSISTLYYHFTRNDKLTLFCRGKRVNTMSVNRLADAGVVATQPVGLSVGLDTTYWFADNAAAKVYQVTLDNVLVQAIDYASIGCVEVSGVSIQTDGTLWLFDKAQSRVYRYLVAEGTVGLSFPTTSVAGLGATLTNGVGLTIDTGNLLYVHDIASGMFYVINPFAPTQPTLLYSWHRSAFDGAATECLDMSADVNLHQLVIVDRQTLKLYRCNQTTGALVSSESLSNIDAALTWPVGVSVAQDGTVFVLNRANYTVYNYNELSTASDNAGYIARDMLQSLAGRTAADFDLKWNDTCRDYLTRYKARCYIKDKTNAIAYCSQLMKQFSAAMFIRYGKYCLQPIHFDYFRTDGKMIREGDIRDGSFIASKETNQYFNTANCEYNTQPFSGEKTTSDTYMSLSGIEFAGDEITKKLAMPNVYLRDDVDVLLPLHVRLASADPEFITMETGWRQLFHQPMDFFNVNFFDEIDPITGLLQGGRRFNNVPAFVRSMELDLDKWRIKWKLWSLGTTGFPGYVPEGPHAGGDGDKIVLSSLGTVGRISPTGAITGATTGGVTLADVGGQDAEHRTAAFAGLAWAPAYAVDVIDAATLQVAATAVIQSVAGQVVTFAEALAFTPAPTVFNSAGFPVGGHYLQHAEYNSSTRAQHDTFSHLGAPDVGYPVTTSQEIEEQLAGLHNFDDNRLPYLLFPLGYLE